MHIVHFICLLEYNAAFKQKVLVCLCWGGMLLIYVFNYEV